MLQKIIEWSLNNKFIVILTVIFAVIGGIYSIQTENKGLNSNASKNN